MNNVLLHCEKLSKTFRDVGHEVPVLQGITLKVYDHEMIAITGKSGSGKSTLLQLLGGLDQPTSGEIYFNGKAYHSHSASQLDKLHNQEIGFIYQFHHLLPEFSALDNVCMPLLLRKIPIKEVQEQGRAMLAEVGLSDRSTHRIAELSGGERQRVAIARALVTQPSCVLADEPTGNLDQENAEHIFSLMKRLYQSKRISFVIVTHDLSLAKQCDRSFEVSSGALNELA